jgi:hypothetical protein
MLKTLTQMIKRIGAIARINAREIIEGKTTIVSLSVLSCAPKDTATPPKPAIITKRTGMIPKRFDSASSQNSEIDLAKVDFTFAVSAFT